MKYTYADATIDGDYRWQLTRIWEPSRECLVYVMLNPSRADAETDDPTLRRCVGFADSNGYGAVVIVNLLPYRTRSPKKLNAWYGQFFGRDPVLFRTIVAMNYAKIEFEVRGKDVVLAWGAHGLHYQLESNKAEGIALRYARSVFTLGHRTRDAQPRHPLYLAGDTRLSEIIR